MALTPIFTNLTITFINNEFLDFDTYFPITIGEKYTVIWDGKEYVCTAESTTILDHNAIVLGNKALIDDVSTPSEPPFVLGVLPDLMASGGYTSSTEPDHIVSLYLGAEEKVKTVTGLSATYTGGKVNLRTDINSLTGLTVIAEYDDGSTETITNYTLSGNIREGNNTITVTYEGVSTTFIVVGIPDGIVLKNRLGDDVVYKNVKTIVVDHTDGSPRNYRSMNIKNIAIDPDSDSYNFSGGDITVSPTEDTVYSTIVINKPDELIPQNIAKNKTIAGVTGTYIGDTQELNVEDLNFADGNMEFIPESDKVYSKVVVEAPSNLQPENIVDGIKIAGILGTFAGGIKDISNASEMNSLLVAKNVGNVYRFVGETTTNYVNGDIYIVEEVE